jgi:hypothetical protein
MSENPIVEMSLSRRKDLTNGNPAENVRQGTRISLSESNINGLSAAEKQLLYFRSLNPDLLCDWEGEFKSLTEVDTDDFIQARLKYYYKFVNFMCNDRVIALIIFLYLYYVIAFGFVLIYSKKYTLTVFYVSMTIIYAFSILCIKTVKGKIFGKMLNKTKDVASIGYYQLLNMKYNYIENQQTVKRHRESIGIIPSKFVRDRGSDRSSISSGTHQTWMLLVFINFTANAALFFYSAIVGYSTEKHTKVVYYYYLFLWSFIDRFICFMGINYLIIVMASMIYASSATQMLCFNWIQRLDKYKKISADRYNLLVVKQMERKEDDHDVLPSVSRIQLDLFERYLFIVGALLYTSRIFNIVTATITGASVLFFMIFAYCLYTTEILIFLSFMFYLTLGFFGTVGCMSYANTSIGRIMEVLKMSVPTLKLGCNNEDPKVANATDSSSPSPLLLSDLGKADNTRISDFELIGGREYWINYINEVPGKHPFTNYIIIGLTFCLH